MSKAFIPEEQSGTPEPFRQDSVQDGASFEVLRGCDSLPIPIVTSDVPLVCNLWLDSPIRAPSQEGHDICILVMEVFHVGTQESNMKLVQRAVA